MSRARSSFLINLNVGEAVANRLRRLGRDVLFVGDRDPRMRDIDILRLGVQERRIIITLDTGFGELVYHSGESHAGVLLLRVANARAAEKVSTVEEIITRYSSQLPHRFSVYRDGRLRIRG